ncbi:M15 family metallopeptidase [Shewanella sp. 202IG2-18]|uniref:M15 family metallopeptidase n=1 Tax=Parashewanella hymeniacidonis TaxID=2807618 RepID=UPI00195FD77F|nr:M15 family metallopeptidase [Parashewanella hymeniacidonis]MBM7070888.1 M15 family metallopeptidase [Parashewanella hymeniacidonis]
MPRFGKTSDNRLDTCHIDLQLIFKEVVKRYDCSIFCGHRGKAEQQEAFNSGNSQLQFPNSKHNLLPSMAVDAGPYFKELKNTSWEDACAFALFAGYVKRVSEELLERGIIKHRLRWGGDWDSDGRTLDESFKDYPHFELIPA